MMLLLLTCGYMFNTSSPPCDHISVM